jgi:hypothetical protein
VGSQQNLTCGINAIHVLVESEINNFRVNIFSKNASAFQKLRQRIVMSIHHRVFKFMLWIWHSNFRFERIFLDIALIATKP